jgi:hypothetical protein
MSPRRWAAWVSAALVALGAAAIGASPAQAAVPDRSGFVLFAGGVVSQASPAGTTVTPSGLGRWTIRFPGQGIPGGVVHVTAVHDGLATPPGRWCQAESWTPVGADEVVKVACYALGGGLDSRPGFSVLFSRSSGVVGGGLYGYIDSSAVGAIITQYNSVGAANAVAHVGIGLYSVSFPGLGTASPNGGSLQLTAVSGTAGARCKVAAWSSTPNGQSTRILCHNEAGVVADNRFTISFQFRRSLYGPAFPPNRFGYLWNSPPLGPAPTNFNSTGVPNVLAGAGPWTVRYPNLASAPGNTQVTAFGAGSDFCNLQTPWTISGVDILARVACYNNAGVPVPTGFFASYSARA